MNNRSYVKLDFAGFVNNYTTTQLYYLLLLGTYYFYILMLVVLGPVVKYLEDFDVERNFYKYNTIFSDNKHDLKMHIIVNSNSV